MPTFQRLIPQSGEVAFLKTSEAWVSREEGGRHIVPANEVAAGSMCSR